MEYLAHAGHGDSEAASGGLLDALTHLPTWGALLVVAFVLAGVYMLLEKFKIAPVNRILLLMPLLILIGIVYLEHNPYVTTVVLSVGFIAAFFLAFVLLTGQKDKADKPDK